MPQCTVEDLGCIVHGRETTLLPHAHHTSTGSRCRSFFCLLFSSPLGTLTSRSTSTLSGTECRRWRRSCLLPQPMLTFLCSSQRFCPAFHILYASSNVSLFMVLSLDETKHLYSLSLFTQVMGCKFSSLCSFRIASSAYQNCPTSICTLKCHQGL